MTLNVEEQFIEPVTVSDMKLYFEKIVNVPLENDYANLQKMTDNRKTMGLSACKRGLRGIVNPSQRKNSKGKQCKNVS